MLFHKKQYPSPSVRLAEPGEEQAPGATIPAPLEDYLDWLRGYFHRGGRPTHFYDRPFGGFELAIGEALVDGGTEYGARSRAIIVGKHASIALKHGGRAFGGWAHTNVYFLCDFSTPQYWVPVYSDPEFEEILTDEHRKQRAKAKTAEREHLIRAKRRTGRGDGERDASGPSGPTTLGQDDACLSALAGASFGPDASLTLPSNTTLSSPAAQAWTSLYRDGQ